MARRREESSGLGIICEHCQNPDNEAVEALEVRRGGTLYGYVKRLCVACAAEYRATFPGEVFAPGEVAPPEE